MHESYPSDINELIPPSEKAITRYPELMPLAEVSGEVVVVTWNSKQYIVSAHKRNFGQGEEVILGMWDTTTSKESPTPVAYADCTIVGNQAEISKAFFAYTTPTGEDFPEEVRALANLKGVEERANVGFGVSTDYREEGLGQLLNALAMVTLEAQGATEILYDDDLTIKKAGAPGAHNQFKGSADRTSPTEQPSFYGKYAPETQTVQEVVWDSFGPYEKQSTQARTHISGMQQSLLNEALGRYS